MTNAEIDTAVISDCCVRSLDSSINIVSNVADSAWGNDTPCTDWNVKDVVNHIVDENIWMVALFNGRTIAEVGNEFEGNLVGDDPAGVYERTANDVKAILAEPDAMSRTCQISSGPVSVAEYSKQLFLDTLIHGWDIAVGSGPDAILDDVAAGLADAAAADRFATWLETEIDRDWEEAIANTFSLRSGNHPADDLWARVLAGAIMGVVRSTMNYWFDRKCEDDLTQLGLDALDFLERGFPHRVH